MNFCSPYTSSTGQTPTRYANPLEGKKNSQLIHYLGLEKGVHSGEKEKVNDIHDLLIKVSIARTKRGWHQPPVPAWICHCESGYFIK